MSEKETTNEQAEGQGKPLFDNNSGKKRTYRIRQKSPEDYADELPIMQISRADIRKIALHFYRRGLDDFVTDYSERRHQNIEDTKFSVRQLKRVQTNWLKEGVIR